MLNANANYIGFGNQRRLTLENGNAYVDSGYQIIYFNYVSGSIHGNGTGSFTLPANREVEFMIIGGGGTGGLPRRASGLNAVQAQYAAGAAGGGAGTLITGSFLGLQGVRYNTVVGAGGVRNYGTQAAPSTDPARNGAPSYIFGTSAQGSIVLFAPGGGAGGSVTVDELNSTVTGSTGGSGGGAGAEILSAGPFIELGLSGSSSAGSGSAIVSLTSFQNAGGAAVDSGAGVNLKGFLGGGGGSGTVGGNGILANNIGGNGGTGSFNAIIAPGRYYAGGGAGGYLTSDPSVGYFGMGGPGGGGGAVNSTTGGTLDVEKGVGEPGSGGGGAAAYSGGSGIIILKYKLDGAIPAQGTNPNTPGEGRYWKFIFGTSFYGSIPALSRIDVNSGFNNDGFSYNVVTFNADNCINYGVIPATGSEYVVDLGISAPTYRILNASGYVVLAGLDYSVSASVQYSNDLINWTTKFTGSLNTTARPSGSTCGTHYIR